MYYEAHLQAHVDYNATYRKRRINKTQVRRQTEILIREQYLQVNRKHLLLIYFEINYA